MSKFQETDQTIQQAFFKVLAAETFETITINKICSAAKISRTTFYRHYMDKYAPSIFKSSATMITNS